MGGVLDGLEPGIKIDMENLQEFLKRRRPGGSKYVSKRREDDKPIFLSGLKDGISTGGPLSFIVENKGARSSDYDMLKDIPRPGHGDYPARVKHQGYEDHRGGGHLSARTTAPVCIGGGICLQVLEEKSIEISASIVAIGNNHENPYQEIEKARLSNDSVGGIISCSIRGLEPGLGGPKASSVEARLSYNIFALIPGVKGIEFGAGFDISSMYGSQANDPYYYEDSKVKLKTNKSGGVLGGMTTGQPIEFRLALKPTPSIGKVQESVNLKTKENVRLEIKGRHDPSIVPRAIPVVEAVAGLTIYDILKD